jgi:hypothetical protein
MSLSRDKGVVGEENQDIRESVGRKSDIPSLRSGQAAYQIRITDILLF